MNPFTIQVSAPANIAFIKYWGKSDDNLQWPTNDSVSMTLLESRTLIDVKLSPFDEDRLYFDGELVGKSSNFGLKIYKHLDFLRSHLQTDNFLELHSENTFPNSCGIASSASSLAAITLAALGAWTNSKTLDELYERIGFDEIVNYARMGSGSACRSFLPGFVHWQKGTNAKSQSIAKVEVHPDFEFCDLIAVVSSEAKKVSSSEAHRYAWSSPLFLPRLAGIQSRTKALLNFLKQGQFFALAELVEQEALDLHAVAMSSTPSVHYMNEDSSQLMAWVKHQRIHQGLPAFFTLDAGPNVHIICRKSDQNIVHQELINNFKNLKVLIDYQGSGPTYHYLES